MTNQFNGKKSKQSNTISVVKRRKQEKNVLVDLKYKKKIQFMVIYGKRSQSMKSKHTLATVRHETERAVQLAKV